MEATPTSDWWHHHHPSTEDIPAGRQLRRFLCEKRTLIPLHKDHVGLAVEGGNPEASGPRVQNHEWAPPGPCDDIQGYPRIVPYVLGMPQEYPRTQGDSTLSSK